METYITKGTCSQSIEFEVNDDHIITACRFIGGCTGNTQAVARLVLGRKAEDMIGLLEGIQCRNGTSCPDQLSKALISYLQKSIA